MDKDKEKRKEKPDMEDGLKAKAVNYIRRLREAFPGDAIFGRSDMMKEIDLKASRASEFLKELESQGIIEPVTGHGKGKYRFKNHADAPAQNDAPVKPQKAKDARKSQKAEDARKSQKAEDAGKSQEAENLAKPQKAEDPVKPQKTEVKEPVQAKSSFSGCKITEGLPVWLL
jgi:ribosomal protein S25